MENEWAKALSNDKTGKLEIKVKIKPIYEDLTQRPTEFVVKYKIGNADWETERYKNERGEKRKNDTRK